MKDNLVREKSKGFAVQIVRVYQYLTEEYKEYILSKQLLRSGTSIGANVREATQGFSQNDFIYKLTTALKESEETQYWLELLYETDYLTQKRIHIAVPRCKRTDKIIDSYYKNYKSRS